MGEDASNKLPLLVGKLALSLWFVGITAASVAGVGVPRQTARAQGQPTVPTGFRIGVFARGLTNPTAMAVGPDRRLYVALQAGSIEVVASHGVQTIASGFTTILGLAWHNHKLYVSSTGKVSTLTPRTHYRFWRRRDIVTGLPTRRHQNDGMAFRGRWMYLGLGSTCDACKESNPRSATIMRFHDDGSMPQIYARGVRNPYGLAIRPATHQLYATDNGRDYLGDTVPDELNLIVRGGRYGWPGCYGNHLGTHCAGTIQPVALFPSHASADGLAFYSGAGLGSYYRGSAFVAEFGDTIDNLGTGHVVQYVHFGPRHITVGTFAQGFQNPLAVTISPKGALLVADYGTGIVWKIWK